MKNIVVCCDGTNAKYDSEDDNTNVIRLFERLGKDGDKQVSFYDPGVGTISSHPLPLVRWLHKAWMAAFGSGVRTNVEQAYRYLMDTYEPGDKVYIYGYSRGAHTARGLAGMLHRCGLLTKGSHNLVPYATRMYEQSDDEIAAGFKASFSRECKPHFIGVWDTVASMGYLWWRKYFRNQVLNNDVRYGYHALATNERRSYFQVALWDENDLPDDQEIVQVWFPGFHSDVGGQKADRRISDITLEWMLRHAGDKGLCLRNDWREWLRSDPTSGQITPSDRHIWRLTAEDRTIPEGAKAHESVVKRLECTESHYVANNLPETFDVVA